ncbi:MAG: DUF4407 domain-containing protein [Desulfobulbus sp.]|jgi:hypothetical protein
MFTSSNQSVQDALRPSIATGATTRPFRPLRVLYWLAGARPATLERLPASECERIAVLGSSVLIPTLLAFFGMYLYASGRFSEPRPVVTCLIALAWSFIIMNVDRILMATYRPFQPWRRKTAQVVFRIGLAGMISVAIAFPFCLHEYRGAIHERLRGEYRQWLVVLQEREQRERALIEQEGRARIAEVRGQLEAELGAGSVNPRLYAEQLALADVRRRQADEGAHREELAAGADAALTAWKEASARMRTAQQDLRAEERGILDASRGGTGKSGKGARYNELHRNLQVLTQAETLARQRYEQLLARSAAVLPEEPTTDPLSALDKESRDLFIAEAQTRSQRIDRLREAVTRAEDDLSGRLRRHDALFGPELQRYQGRLEGRFDPMEETIGLYKVIFVPQSDGPDGEGGVGQYKWMAALFQFVVVFGSLFLLDLIAILSKVMSRPGPYDVLIEFPEMVADENFAALRREYPRCAAARAADAADSAAAEPAGSGTPTETERGVDVRDPEALAQLLLRAYVGKSSGGAAEE